MSEGDYVSEHVKLIVEVQEDSSNLRIEHMKMSFDELFSLVDNLMEKLSDFSEIPRNELLDELKEVHIDG